MYTVFKQIFKSLLKNGLLIFSLFLIIATLILIGASSLQLSSSITNSVNNVNNQGNAAQVVGKSLPYIGNISYKLVSENPNPADNRKIYVSTLEPNENPKLIGASEYDPSHVYKKNDAVWIYDKDSGKYKWFISAINNNTGGGQ